MEQQAVEDSGTFDTQKSFSKQSLASYDLTLHTLLESHILYIVCLTSLMYKSKEIKIC